MEEKSSEQKSSAHRKKILEILPGSNPQTSGSANVTTVTSDTSTPETNRNEQSCCGPRYIFNTDIPDSYDENYIAVLVKDPEWLYIYWELSNANIPTGTSVSDVEHVLHLFESNSNDSYNNTFEFTIDKNASHWYLRVPEPGKKYGVELGIKINGGMYRKLLASTQICTPVGDRSLYTEKSIPICNNPDVFDVKHLSQDIPYDSMQIALVNHSEFPDIVHSNQECFSYLIKNKPFRDENSQPSSPTGAYGGTH